MKVVGVISSPSRNGNTAVLVREALRGAAERGAEVEEIFLAEHKLRFCNGCGECLARGRCVTPDEFEDLKERVQSADGVVLGSPTYGAEPNALMKNFFDRLGMLFFLTSAFGGKYAVGISTASGFGADATAKKLAGIATASVLFDRGYASGTLAVLRRGRRVEDVPDALARARQLGGKLADDVRQRRGYPFQNLPARLMNALFVRKGVEKAVVENRQGPMKAVYEDLVARGLIQAPASAVRLSADSGAD